MDIDIIQNIEMYEQRLHILRNKLRSSEKSIYPAEVYNQTITDRWSMYHGDCITTIKGLPDEAIHYSIFSPPFLSLYVYSDDLKDMGNNKTDDEFYNHFSYLIPELFRVLKTGRLVSVHCSVIGRTIQHDGIMGLKDLPGMIVRLFESFGFQYHSKVTIWKDPLLQAVRTKALHLAHKQIITDSSRCGMGFADEILTFRKVGENIEKILHPNGFRNYIGEMEEPKEKKNDNPKIDKYSHEVWQRYASPVWFDIRQTNTLNFHAGRDSEDERHICPLQLDVISRCLELWTNEGDIVLSPFAGIGSEGFEALQMKRKFIGIELKESYYQTALKNLELAETRIKPIV